MMKSKIMMKSTYPFIFTVFIVFFAVISATPAFGQGNVSVLFDGTVLAGKTNFFKAGNGNNKLNGMKAENVVLPGVEVRFNQKGRVSFGVGYQRWNLKQDEASHASLLVYRDGQEKFVTWDEDLDAAGDVVLATVYVNLTTRGKVRPFIGGGPGFGRFRVSTHMRNVMDVSPPFFESESAKQILKSRTEILVKGVGGLNIYPTKHCVISLGGGYINGPAITLGLGFTF